MVRQAHQPGEEVDTEPFDKSYSEPAELLKVILAEVWLMHFSQSPVPNPRNNSGNIAKLLKEDMDM